MSSKDYKKVLLIAGSNQESPHFHYNPINLSSLPLGYQIIQFNINSISTHAGRDDWYT